MTEAAAQPANVQIGVLAQYIRDFSFECPNVPQIFAPSQATPTLDMGVNVQTRPLPDGNHECLLMLKLEAKLEDKVAFIGELAYGGVFALGGLPQEHIQPFMFIEAPRLLFPFARSILGTAIRDAGFPQVLINPIDFVALYQQHVAQMNQPPQGNA